MKYAKIVSGAVEQVQPYAESGFTEVPDGTIPGMLDNGDGTFSNPPPDPAPVPQSVTRFQALAALHNAGLLDAVKALMADPATDPITVLAWDNGQTFNRNSSTIISMGTVLGLTSTDLDNLFIAAAQITVQ